MLKIRRGPAPVHVVALPGGATWSLRPASQFEVEEATARCRNTLVALVLASECAEDAAQLMGEEFRAVDFADPAWQAAAAEHMAAVELATLCSVAWSGIVDENEQPIPEPTREFVVQLLRDTTIAELVKPALFRGVHEELAEKKE